MNFRCETQGEQAFQQIIGQKLIGLHLPPQQTIVSLMKELLLDLRILREEKQVGLESPIQKQFGHRPVELDVGYSQYHQN